MGEINRRTVIGAVWSVPVIAVAATGPSAAASEVPPEYRVVPAGFMAVTYYPNAETIGGVGAYQIDGRNVSDRFRLSGLTAGDLILSADFQFGIDSTAGRLTWYRLSEDTGMWSLPIFAGTLTESGKTFDVYGVTFLGGAFVYSGNGSYVFPGEFFFRSGAVPDVGNLPTYTSRSVWVSTPITHPLYKGVSASDATLTPPGGAIASSGSTTFDQRDYYVSSYYNGTATLTGAFTLTAGTEFPDSSTVSLSFTDPTLLTIDAPVTVDPATGTFSFTVRSTGTNLPPYVETQVTIGAPGFSSSYAFIYVPDPE
jgi:hypothetical protein